MFRTPHTTSIAAKHICVAALLACCTFTGCKPRENGVAFSNTEAKSVDPSWVAAAKSCWPDLAHNGLSNAAIIHNLTDPIHFRNTFSAYASLSDADIETIVAHRITDAPEPNHTPMLQSRTPVLTRTQAATSAAPPPSAPVGGLPDDVLCSLQSGTPVGFK